MEIYCPVCKSDIRFHSYYLSSIFGEHTHTYKVACLVTHYRHYHVSYYNKGVSYVSKYHDYSIFKRKVNNRAKRQLIRAIQRDSKYSKDEVVSFVTAILDLESNDNKTIEMINNIIVLNQKNTLDTYIGVR
jgi:hypothetical protein